RHQVLTIVDPVIELQVPLILVIRGGRRVGVVTERRVQIAGRAALRGQKADDLKSGWVHAVRRDLIAREGCAHLAGAGGQRIVDRDHLARRVAQIRKIARQHFYGGQAATRGLPLQDLAEALVVEEEEGAVLPYRAAQRPSEDVLA